MLPLSQSHHNELKFQSVWKYCGALVNIGSFWRLHQERKNHWQYLSVLGNCYGLGFQFQLHLLPPDFLLDLSTHEYSVLVCVWTCFHWLESVIPSSIIVNEYPPFSLQGFSNYSDWKGLMIRREQSTAIKFSEKMFIHCHKFHGIEMIYLLWALPNLCARTNTKSQYSLLAHP